MQVGDFVFCTRSGNDFNGVSRAEVARFGFGRRDSFYRVVARPDATTVTLASLDGLTHGKSSVLRFRLATPAEVINLLGNEAVDPHQVARPNQREQPERVEFNTYQVVYRNSQGALSQVTFVDPEAARRKVEYLQREGREIVARKKFTIYI